jgi:hypothetical protein
MATKRSIYEQMSLINLEHAKEHNASMARSTQLANEANFKQRQLSMQRDMQQQQINMARDAQAHQMRLDQRTINVGGKDFPIDIPVETLKLILDANKAQTDTNRVNTGDIIANAGKVWHPDGGGVYHQQPPPLTNYKHPGTPQEQQTKLDNFNKSQQGIKEGNKAYGVDTPERKQAREADAALKPRERPLPPAPLVAKQKREQ